MSESWAFTQGSGFFISQDGHILTNRHVLQGAVRAVIKIAEGNVYPVGQVMAEDTEGDLLRVSVDIPSNVVRPLSVSTSLPEVGERVIVIGNPLGLEQTVSDGIVAAVREIPAFGKMIQITAPISPGSSGSPVLNMKGEVIGVATLSVVKGQNLNFAIPGERVVRLTPRKRQPFAEWGATGEEERLASAEGLYFIGLLFLSTEAYEKALPYFREAVKKNPYYALAYVAIGYCTTQLGRYTEAIAAYNQAIWIKPDFAEAHYGLGLTYLKLGDLDSAFDEYKTLKALNKDLANTLFTAILYNAIYK